MAGISSKASAKLENKFKYTARKNNGRSLAMVVGWSDFMLRSYDPQTGRFLQHDPYDQFASGYVGMVSTDVEMGNVIDPTGGWGDGLGQVLTSVTSSAHQTAGVGYNTVVTFKRIVSTTISIAKEGGKLAKEVNNLLWNTLGFTTGLVDNLSGGLINLRQSNAPNPNLNPTAASNYNAGFVGSDVVGMGLAVIEGGAGQGLANTGVGLTLTGAVAEVEVPMTVVGIGMEVHSVFVFKRSTQNLINGSGQVKAAPNDGNGGSHGGSNHNKAIDERINDLKQLEKAGEFRNIRKNQRQVDAGGNNKGANRPDIQYYKYNPNSNKWEHHHIEYDNIPENSVEHGKILRKHDPNSQVELNIL